jgi:hypothetical protein
VAYFRLHLHKMRVIAIFLFLTPFVLFAQKVPHDTFLKIMRTDKVFVDPQTVKVDTLRRYETRGLLNYQMAASLASYLLSENRDTMLRLSCGCPNLILLSEGTVIIYWDSDTKSFQGTFIQDREHTALMTVAACSRVYSIQLPVLSDSPATDSEPDPNATNTDN